MQYNLFMYCNGDPVDNYDCYGTEAVAIGIAGVCLTIDVIEVAATILISAVLIYVVVNLVIVVNESLQEIYFSKKVGEKEGTDDDESPRKKRVGKQNGKRPRNNGKQNKQVDDIMKKLKIKNPNLRRNAHDYIQGGDFDFKGLEDELEIFKNVSGKKGWKY